MIRGLRLAREIQLFDDEICKTPIKNKLMTTEVNFRSEDDKIRFINKFNNDQFSFRLRSDTKIQAKIRSYDDYKEYFGIRKNIHEKSR